VFLVLAYRIMYSYEERQSATSHRPMTSNYEMMVEARPYMIGSRMAMAVVATHTIRLAPSTRKTSNLNPLPCSCCCCSSSINSNSGSPTARATSGLGLPENWPLTWPLPAAARFSSPTAGPP